MLTLCRVDMEDESGTRMCLSCGHDAMESGLFAEKDAYVDLSDCQTRNYVVEHSPDMEDAKNDMWTVGYYVGEEWEPIQDCDSMEEAVSMADQMNRGIVQD